MKEKLNLPTRLRLGFLVVDYKTTVDQGVMLSNPDLYSNLGEVRRARRKLLRNAARGVGVTRPAVGSYHRFRNSVYGEHLWDQS